MSEEQGTQILDALDEIQLGIGIIAGVLVVFFLVFIWRSAGK